MPKSILNCCSSRNEKSKMGKTADDKREVKTAPDDTILEDDFLVDMINGAIDERNSGEEEEVQVEERVYDPVSKIASIIQKKKKYESPGGGFSPLNQMVAGMLAGEFSFKEAEENASLQRMAPHELAGILLSAEASKKLPLGRKAGEIRRAEEYVEEMGLRFGGLIERLLEVMPAKTGQGAKKPEKKKYIRKQEGKDASYNYFFTGYDQPTLVAANYVHRLLKGYEQRLREINDADELAKLVMISIGSKSLPRDEAKVIDDRCINGNFKLDDLVKQVLSRIAKNKGLLQELDADEIPERYEQMMDDRLAYASYIKEELKRIWGVRFDYKMIEEKIIEDIGKKTKLFVDARRVNDKEHYLEFRKSLLNLHLSMFREVKKQAIGDDTRYNARMQELEKAENALKAVKGATEFGEVYGWVNKKDYWNDVVKKACGTLNVSISGEEIGDEEMLGEAGFRQRVRDAITKKVDQNLELILKGSFIKGEAVEVIKLGEINPFDGSQTYYYGGDEEDLPIGSRGEVVGALNEHNLIVSFKKGKMAAGEVYHLHPDEIKAAGRGEYEALLGEQGNNAGEWVTGKLEEIESEIQKGYFMPAKKKAVEDLKDGAAKARMRAEQRLEDFGREMFKRHESVRVARALGKAGYYKFGRLGVKNNPTGMLGEILGTHDDGTKGFWDVSLNSGDIKTFHIDELDKLEKVEISEEGIGRTKVIVTDGTEYNFTKTGSWGYLINETDLPAKGKVDVKFYYLTGEKHEVPTRFDIDVMNLEIVRDEKEEENKRKESHLISDIEKIVAMAEGELNENITQKNNLIKEAVNNLSAMGISKGAIKIFLGLYADINEYVASGIIEDVDAFSEIRALQKKTDYNKLAAGIEEGIQKELGIFLFPTQFVHGRFNSKEYNQWIQELPDLLARGFKADEKKAGDFKRGDYVIGTLDDDDMPGEAVERYIEDCDCAWNDDLRGECHVRLEENGDIKHVKKAGLRLAERIAEDPLENIKRRGEYVTGERVRISKTSRHYDQHGGIGILQQVFGDRDGFAEVRWEDGYNNQYQLNELELVADPKRLKGEELARYKAAKARFEDTKKELSGKLEGIIQKAGSEEQRTFEKIIHASDEIADSLLSLGVEKENIRRLFERNLEDTAYLRF